MENIQGGKAMKKTIEEKLDEVTERFLQESEKFFIEGTASIDEKLARHQAEMSRGHLYHH